MEGTAQMLGLAAKVGGQAAVTAAQAAKLAYDTYQSTNQPVVEDNAFTEDSVVKQVFVLIIALDYKKTANPLTCSIDGKNMERLLSQCGIPSENITALYDDQNDCTKEGAIRAIQEVGGKCGEGDFFLFYYSGHGTNLRDVNGDETDGKDEAFCFVDERGQVSQSSCMTDDLFAEIYTASVDASVQSLILTDCCHSGTICDFGHDCWEGRKAISITGCLDSQTSGDIGRGGIFTHSMMQAIGQLSIEGEERYSVGKLYNVTIEKDESIFRSQQKITMQCAPHFLPSEMAWPLIPQGIYLPPLGQRSLDIAQ